MTTTATGTPALPPVRKTPQMLEIEATHGGRDIRLILKELYEQTGNQSEVARIIGIEQPTISVWAMRLGMTFTSKPVAEIGAVPASLAA